MSPNCSLFQFLYWPLGFNSLEACLWEVENQIIYRNLIFGIWYVMIARNRTRDVPWEALFWYSQNVWGFKVEMAFLLPMTRGSKWIVVIEKMMSNTLAGPSHWALWCKYMWYSSFRTCASITKNKNIYLHGLCSLLRGLILLLKYYVLSQANIISIQPWSSVLWCIQWDWIFLNFLVTNKF